MIAIHGAYYSNNFGDLLLIKLFESWIRSRVDCEIVYPLVPERQRERFGREFPGVRLGLEGARRWKALVYVGGGYLGEPEKVRGSRLGGKWNQRFLSRHVLPAAVCIWNGTPYAVLGVEAGPLSNVLVRSAARQILGHAQEVSGRNEESGRFARELLEEGANVHVAPDAALSIDRSDIPAEAMETVERMLGPDRGSRLLGIHSPSHLLSEDPKTALLMDTIVSQLSSARDVTPVVFSDRGDAAMDAACGRLSARVTASIGRECLSIPFAGIWETCALISRLSAIVTTKLHVGIVAYALGVYSESFAVHQKTPRFYRQINGSSRCEMLKDLDVTTASEKVARVVSAARYPFPIEDEFWRSIKKKSDLHRDLLSSFLRSALSA